ncbi:hypothetical protein VCRA2114E365_260014 [Vibrio crassostreae]|nr:hypothetical protein VCRA2114E123_230065 [Vibrio crassostreae]CAK1932200.1 hypothetical protein VCRA2115O371_240065 [Vibrio crassostreae]CAK1939164.1 hypothetical protein VCRA2117O376_250014 [Vibrio crassostreae]CAK1940665.1 hypothetical protein VCRA2117O378_270014 [Vibrio crassostreae]CAK1945108.1 hypothetical protein VCRA2113O357_250014 [Vibrio crassostreae]
MQVFGGVIIANTCTLAVSANNMLVNAYFLYKELSEIVEKLALFKLCVFLQSNISSLYLTY